MRVRCLRQLGFVAACGFLLVAGAGAEERTAHSAGMPTGQHPAALEDELDRHIVAATQALFRSRIRDAQRIAEEARQMAPRDPRVYILDARIQREMFPEQSTNGEHLENLSAPMHAQLQTAIQICDSLIQANDKSAPGYLYRGWAHLFRAQMHTLCDEYWSAGRQAKAGKEDIDRALALAPGTPDAQCILGTYLYFADILPRIVKLVRTVVRVPGGDRDRGIELLRAAAAADGYNQLDSRALLGVIAVAFEGDLDTGGPIFESLMRDYPNNPRLLEPLAVLDVMHPENHGLDRIAEVSRQFSQSPEDLYRQLSQRLMFYQSLSEIVQGRAEEAAKHLDEVWESGPSQPDWFPGDVALCLAETRALLGDRDAAVAMHAGVAKDSRMESRLRFVVEPGAAATREEAADFHRGQLAARAIYAGDFAGARAQLDDLGASEDPGISFYRGELARLTGDATQAKTQFQRLTERALAPRWRLYKTLSFARLAELQGAEGDPGRAAETLGRALDFDSDRDLLRHMMRARRRHFELARDGEALAPSSGGSAPTTTGASDAP